MVIGWSGQHGQLVRKHVELEAIDEIELVRILSLHTEVKFALEPLGKKCNVTLNHVQVDNIIFSPISYFHQAS